MTPPTPLKLDLKKDERLRVEWSDGAQSIYPLPYLRQMCPCAACRLVRTGHDPHQLLQSDVPPPRAREQRSRGTPANETSPFPAQKKSLSLAVLPKNFVTNADAAVVHVTAAELVGNYALRLDWSDGHASGIYSFAYLREIAS